MLRGWVVLAALFCAGGCAEDYRLGAWYPFNFSWSSSRFWSASAENIPGLSRAIFTLSFSPLWSSQMVETDQPSPRALRADCAKSSEAYAFIAPSGCSAISTCSSPLSRQTTHISMIWSPCSGGRGLNLQVIGIWSQSIRGWAEGAALFCAEKCAEGGKWANNRALAPDPFHNHQLSRSRAGWLAPRYAGFILWRRVDLNHRPLGYEPSELPLLHAAVDFVAHHLEAVKPSTAHPAAQDLGGQANGGLS
jgi:hypothetical protein